MMNISYLIMKMYISCFTMKDIEEIYVVLFQNVIINCIGNIFLYCKYYDNFIKNTYEFISTQSPSPLLSSPITAITIPHSSLLTISSSFSSRSSSLGYISIGSLFALLDQSFSTRSTPLDHYQMNPDHTNHILFVRNQNNNFFETILTAEAISNKKKQKKTKNVGAKKSNLKLEVH